MPSPRRIIYDTILERGVVDGATASTLANAIAERLKAQSFLLLQIIGDVEPELHGPFETEEARFTKARRLRAQDPEKKNGLFKLDLSPAGVTVDAFAGADLDT